MGMLAWVMMGLALWHFTIWLPDRYWGGIVVKAWHYSRFFLRTRRILNECHITFADILDECARALDAVRAAEGHAECLLFEPQARVFFHRERGPQRGFRLAQRDGEFAGNFLGQFARRFDQIAGRHDLVDEP